MVTAFRCTPLQLIKAKETHITTYTTKNIKTWSYGSLRDTLNGHVHEGHQFITHKIII